MYRFVSPQAYTKNAEVLMSTYDDTAIDTSKLIKVLRDNKLAALKDDSTGEELKIGDDFERVILT